MLVKDEPRAQRIDNKTERGRRHGHAERNDREQRHERNECNCVAEASEQNLSPRHDEANDSGDTLYPKPHGGRSLGHAARAKYVAAGACENGREHQNPLHRSTRSA